MLCLEVINEQQGPLVVCLQPAKPWGEGPERVPSPTQKSSELGWGGGWGGSCRLRGRTGKSKGAGWELTCLFTEGEKWSQLELASLQ